MYSRTSRWSLHAVSLCAALLLLPASAVPQTPPGEANGPIVIAVRHAERADDGAERAESDPTLSDIGLARARCLSRTLEDTGITRVFSTDYVRTRSTAVPVAEALGLEVETYDPRALDTFAEALGEATGVVLVVGHSNTTPALVEALGGDPVRPILEEEYDRLYTVFMGVDGARSTLTRYCPA